MTKNFSTHPETDIKRRIYIALTLMLFFILPQRLTKVFVNLSMILLVFKLRQESLTDHEKTLQRLGHMLRLNITDQVLVLPCNTCQWYWPDSVLDKPILIKGTAMSLRTLIIDKQLFLRHRGLVINTLMDALPKSLGVKMGLGNTPNRLSVKHNVTSALLYT